jgi:hypothetical protein
MTRELNDNVVIFDIDGCISDDRWRRSRIPADADQPLQFDFYHAGCGDDPPLEVGSQLLTGHIANGDFIAFCTARPFKVAELTAGWIKRHFSIEPTKDFIILMRKDDDARSAVEVKTEFLSYINKYVEQTGKNLVMAYDDRQDIIDMYRSKGVQVGLLNENGLVQETAQTGTRIDGAPVTLDQLREAHLATLASQNKQPFNPANVATRAKLLSAADILDQAAATYRERNAGYKDNAVMVGAVMKALFPHGVTLREAEDHHAYHLFELMIVKLTRFVKSDLRHADSIHDLAVYAAMVEALATEHNIEVRDQWSED